MNKAQRTETQRTMDKYLAGGDGILWYVFDLDSHGKVPDLQHSILPPGSCQDVVVDRINVKGVPADVRPMEFSEKIVRDS